MVARGRPLNRSDLPPPQRFTGQSSDGRSVSLDAVVEAWARRQLEESGDQLTDLHDRMLAATEPALLRVAWTARAATGPRPRNCSASIGAPSANASSGTSRVQTPENATFAAGFSI